MKLLEIADAIKNAELGATILVDSDVQKELAERACAAHRLNRLDLIIKVKPNA